VEFWATWCQPCRASMPHIAELQTSYGDQVRFIGVSDEEESVVKDFMQTEQSEGKTWDDVVTYTMAMDDAGTTNRRYMAAAQQNGIPTAFIVGKDGVLEWIGHPMEIEEPLKQVVDGIWDREKAVQEAIARAEARKRMKEIQMKMAEAVQNQDWDAAIALLDEVAKEQPAGSPGILLTRATFLRNAGRDSEARSVVEEVTEKYWEESNMLNAIAWNLAAEMGGVELDLALKMALRADELEGGKSASIHDTVARVYYEKEDLDSAIEWQKKAVEAATGSDGNLQETLEKYEEEKKLRESDKPEAENTEKE
jgi:thiol-disulfide isomerase/thioredoxin